MKYIITEKDIGTKRPLIREIDGKKVHINLNVGGLMACDIGKMCFEKNGVWYMESQRQLEQRKKEEKEKENNRRLLNENKVVRGKYLHYNITARFFAYDSVGWDDKSEHNHYKITVSNTRNKVRVTFDFWTSLAKPVMIEESKLIEAFYSFLSDAISGNDSFEEFCSNFGYDEDSRKAERVWRACKKAYTKANSLIDDDLYDFINKMQEECNL